jgi:hypothetical protein
MAQKPAMSGNPGPKAELARPVSSPGDMGASREATGVPGTSDHEAVLSN